MYGAHELGDVARKKRLFSCVIQHGSPDQRERTRADSHNRVLRSSQEAGLAAGASIGNRRSLVGLLSRADIPERLAVSSATPCHIASEESAQQAQGEEIRDQGAEAAPGRSEPSGIASCEDAHAGSRGRQFRSLHPRLLHRKRHSTLSAIERQGSLSSLIDHEENNRQITYRNLMR